MRFLLFNPGTGDIRLLIGTIFAFFVSTIVAYLAGGAALVQSSTRWRVLSLPHRGGAADFRRFASCIDRTYVSGSRVLVFLDIIDQLGCIGLRYRDALGFA